MALELILEEYRDLAVVALEGSVQASNAGFLLDTMEALLDDGHTRFVLDCRGLSSISSDGLAVLVDLLEQMEPEGKLVLCHASQKIRNLLELSGLDRFIEYIENRDDAIKRVRH